MTRYLPAISLLSALLLILRDAGPLAVPSTNAAVILLVSVSLISTIPNRPLSKKILSSIIALVSAIVVVSLLAARVPYSFLLLVAVLYFLAGKVALKDTAQIGTLCSALAISGFLFGMAHMVYLTEPRFWFGAQYVSQAISRYIGAVTDQPILLGGTAAGLFISLLFILFGAIAFTLSVERRPRDILLYCFGIIVANGVFVAGVHRLVEWGQVLAKTQAHPMNLLLVLLLLESVSLYFFVRNRRFIPVSFTLVPSSWKATLLSTFCLVLSLGLSWSADANRFAPSSTVVSSFWPLCSCLRVRPTARRAVI
jgi:hypothetical protein